MSSRLIFPVCVPLLALYGAVAQPAAAVPSSLPDHNADGFHNVLDVAIERGLPGGSGEPRSAAETILFDPLDQTVAAGGEVRVLALLDQSFIPLFGYSLDIDVTPVGGAAGQLVANVSLTNFVDDRNLITAGGAMRDTFFSVIQVSLDGGLFVSTNTSDLSAVLAAPGINDVLAELVFDATPGASGVFEITIGPGSALADEFGKPVFFETTVATITVESASSGPGGYETGDRTGSNDTFETREIVSVNDANCFYLSGKLQTNEFPGRYPDTYLFMFDKFDNVVCQDDNSSTKGNGKASACFGVAPIPNGDDANATVRLGVTGRPDGVDNMFNGLFFNAPHGQLGEAEVCVTYYDGGGSVIDTDTYLCTFVTGAEAFRINYVVPAGTATVDVEIDNTTETFPIANDVDFYQLEGLDAACDYVLTVIGGVQADCTPNCAILGWWNKNGEQVLPVATAHPAAQLSVISDANGRVRFSVSGYGDHDFDGLLDASVMPEGARNVGTPGVELPPVHGCASCYTIKVQWNKHVDGGEGGSGSPEGVNLLLANGDLNTDGGVDVIDLAILLNNWGWTAP